MSSLITKDHVMTVLKEETVHLSNKNFCNKTDLKEIFPVTVRKEKNNQSQFKGLDEEAQQVLLVPLV